MSILDLAASTFSRVAIVVPPLADEGEHSEHSEVDQIRDVIAALEDESWRELLGFEKPEITIDWNYICGPGGPSHAIRCFFGYRGWRISPTGIFFHPVSQTLPEEPCLLEALELEQLTTSALARFAYHVACNLERETTMNAYIGRPRTWKLSYLKKAIPSFRFKIVKTADDRRVVAERRA